MKYGCSTHGFETERKTGLQLHMNGAIGGCSLYVERESEESEDNK